MQAYFSSYSAGVRSFKKHACVVGYKKRQCIKIYFVWPRPVILVMSPFMFECAEKLSATALSRHSPLRPSEYLQVGKI